MAATFTFASADRIYVGSTGLNGFSFTYGTVAVWLRVGTQSVANYNSIVTTNDIVGTAFGLIFVNATGGIASLDWADGTNDVGINSSTWNGTKKLIVATKATGAATPRFHVYDEATNTWTHSNGAALFGGAATAVDAAATTSMGIGTDANASGNTYDGDIWQVGMWQGYVMSDLECERLARTRDWRRLGAGFYNSWETGRDGGQDMWNTLGRYKVRQTARTGTTRSTVRAPFGFNTSPPRRRG